MKSRNVIWAIFGLLAGLLSLGSAVLTRHDAKGHPFDESYTLAEEERCCWDCFHHGPQTEDASCHDIIEKHNGIKDCIRLFEEHPHTLAECRQAIVR